VRLRKGDSRSEKTIGPKPLREIEKLSEIYQVVQ
jgi:hypothetical protein